MNKKIKNQLNKNHRLPISVNARKYNGIPLIYSSYVDESNGRVVEHFLDQTTENGGTMTPFNIQCNCCAACAVRTIVKKGDEMVVVFADGDRVAMKRHESDKDDPVTALLWALGQKVFGKNLARQIHTALSNRMVDADSAHAKKVEAKSLKV